jgi:Domain of unknown function DUF11
MHRLIEGVGRRSAGVAAGVILTGGLVGGVLLAPAAAYAGTAAISITSASPSFGGVTVSVSVTGGTQPLGTFSVSGAGSGCTGNLSGGGGGMFGGPGGGNGSGTGSCTIHGVAPGTYALTASYDGATGAGSVTVPAPGPTQNPTQGPWQGGNAPVWSSDSPSTSVDSQSYSYGFQASGSPTYSLVGAPYWLSIDASSGMVSGTIPGGTTSFTYAVQAQNNYGSVNAGPFTVSFQQNFYRHRQHHNEFANLSTSLSCTSPVHTGQRGNCTLDVTNDGYNSASDVTAQITLPYQLRANYCGYTNWFGYGCSISGNTASENLGTLGAGQTRELTVTFTADSGYTLWGRHHGRTFTVQVDGSASSYGNLGTYSYYGQRESSSTAYVTVIPRGFWW